MNLTEEIWGHLRKMFHQTVSFCEQFRGIDFSFYGSNRVHHGLLRQRSSLAQCKDRPQPLVRPDMGFAHLHIADELLKIGLVVVLIGRRVLHATSACSGKEKEGKGPL